MLRCLLIITGLSASIRLLWMRLSQFIGGFKTSKKVFNLVTAIATAVCTFIGFAMAPAVVAAIGVAGTAAIEICHQFVKS